LIGGATTSPKHTAVKIAPAYGHEVIHVRDASRVAGVVERLVDPNRRAEMDAENRAQQQRWAESFAKQRQQELVPYREAVAQRFNGDLKNVQIETPSFTGTRVLEDYPLDELATYIDWSPFFWAWELRGKYPQIFDHPERGSQARKLFEDGQALLRRIVDERRFSARGVYGFWPAAAVGDDILIYEDPKRSCELARFHTLRQQGASVRERASRSLADFVAPQESGRHDFIGGFAVSAGFGTSKMAAEFEAEHDDYRAIMSRVLADRLAEAFAERLHEIARKDWGYGRDEELSKADLIAVRYRGIRPAIGYPSLPDHTEKRTLFDLMNVEQNAGITLTETFMMVPAASVCGLYLAHPESRYFSVGPIDRDQAEDYARRKGVAMKEVERSLAPNLAYDPDE
jgi:5-methyltetrahydrofolate--homocysteine methyltransferase